MSAHPREHISLRGHIARLALRLFLKSGYRREPIKDTRARFARMEWLVPAPPRGTRVENLHVGGMPAVMITVREARPDVTVLFLHGGAYVVASFRNYGHFTWRIGRAARARVLAVDYRLAPEHKFPAALEDATAAYHWMLAHGCKPERMLIAGDSAGGGLTLALMLKLRDEGAPLPAAAIALSPWTDLALTGASLQTNAERDPMLVASELPHFAQLYVGDSDSRNPYVSPLYGDPRGLPPTLIQAGGDEILLDDAGRMAQKMKDACCRVDYQVWSGMPHVFQLLVPVLPEANAAVEEIGKFVQRVLP
jgi:epsilon-lactone hydrolase